MIKIIEPHSFDIPILHYLPVKRAGKFDEIYLNKVANEIPQLSPDPKYEYVYMFAVGSFEKYGCNKNGDAFTTDVCRNYHNTFVKHAKHYKNHKHGPTDPSFGHVVWSTFNEPMGRIELIVALDKNAEENQQMLHKIAMNEPVGVSMSCKVSYDICSICGNQAKSRLEYCDHAKYYLTKLASDGKIICVFNPDPKFFDISEVQKPADRIAYALCKAASSDQRVIPSAELAEQLGMIWEPFTKLSASEYNLYKKLAEMEKELEGVAVKNPKIVKVIKVKVNNKWDDLIKKIDKKQIPEILKYIAHNKIIIPYQKFKALLAKYHDTAVDEEPEVKGIMSVVEPDDLNKFDIFQEAPGLISIKNLIPDLNMLQSDNIKQMVVDISQPPEITQIPSGVKVRQAHAKIIIKKGSYDNTFKLYANLIYAQAQKDINTYKYNYLVNFSNV